MYFPFFELKKWGKKTAEARRHNCAALPWYTLSVLAALGHLFQGERQGSGFLKIWANSLAFSLAAW